MPQIPPGWLDPASQIPRRDQIIRVLTGHGSDHEAQFVVVHTNDWPSGASWLVRNSGDMLPFEEGVAWSPDPEASPGRSAPTTANATGTGVISRPALIDEILDEVDRTASILGLLPAEPMDWSPHPDIPNLRILALRLVRIVGRMGWIMDLEGVERSFEPDLPDLLTPGEIIETFEANAATVRELSARLGGDDLRSVWLLERNGTPLARIPRGNALRLFGLTPLIYHRAEVALLLTAMGISVPHPYPLWAIEDTPAPESEDGEDGEDGDEESADD